MKTLNITTKRILKLIYVTPLFLLLISCGIYPLGDITKKPIDNTPKPGKIDAVVAHKNGHVYFFSGNKYIKWKPGKGVVPLKDGSAKRTFGVTGFTKIPKSFDTGISAAFKYNNLSYFIKNRLYVLSSGGSVKSLNDNHNLIQRLPYSFTKDIDAVVIHPNNKIYFFQKDKYCVYDLSDRNKTFKRVKPEIKIIGKGGWRSLPAFFRSNIDAALLHPTNKKIYFFKGDKYCVWQPGKGVLKPAIRTRGVNGWKGVMFD